MLNDTTYFKNVYIVTGYTDLKSVMDSLASLVESKLVSKPFVPDTLYLSVVEERIVSKDWYWNLMASFFCTNDWKREVFNSLVPNPKSRA
jgi:transposase